jgi:hypothetical protein
MSFSIVMDLIKRSILASAIMTLMLASAMPLLLVPTLQPVEGQFLGDDDSALLGFDDTTTTTNNERLQLDLSATSNNNNTLLRENEKTIRFYTVPLLREAIEDRVGEGNADAVKFVIVGLGSNHTTVGINDTVSLLKREFNSLPKASENSTTAGVKIALDSSQCSSPSPNVANAGECQFTITAATTTAAEGMDNDGLQLDLSAASNNNTLLREYVKNIRFYVAPLLREAIEDRVGEGNADNARIVIVGFDGSTSHTTVGTNDTVSLIRSEFNSLPKASGNSTGFGITLDSSQCSSPSPNVANAGECQFTIRLAQKAYEAAGGLTAIVPPEESGTIGLNDESEQNGTSNNNDDNNGSSSGSSSSSSSRSSSDDCDDSYPDVCIPPPPPVLECSDIDEHDFEVRGSDPHGFDSNGDGVGCEGDGSSSSSSSSSSSDEIERNSISNVLTNILDDIFGDDDDNSDDSSSSSNRISNAFTNTLDDIFSGRLVIGADQMNSVLDRITEDKAQIRQTIEQIAEHIAGATDTD